MKSTKQAANDSGIPESLIRAVIRQLGDKESLQDIARHGIDGGFCGFTYYSDTVKFFRQHRAEIVALVEQMADSLGENPVDMVAGFNCLAGRSGEKREYYPSVSRCLYGGRLTEEDIPVANALSWFAGEEVARAFEE